MKRLSCAALLAFAFVVVPGQAKDSGSARAQKDAGQTAEKVARQKAKEGEDCDTNRAGVRCSRPKPKKVWFWGKA
jgi:uncharacterized low-complexity protein